MTALHIHDARLRLVLDPADHADHHRALRAYADLDAGRAVCELKPGRQTKALLADAVLEGLGKDLDFRGYAKDASRNWTRTVTWLRAHRVEELVALRAQHLDWRGWESIVSMAAQADCALTLVVSGIELDARRDRIAEQWPFARMTFQRWSEAHGSSALPAVPTDNEQPLFPLVPDCDFTLFRAASRKHLSDDDFCRVDARFLQSLKDTKAWVARNAAVDEESVCGHLRGQVRPCRSLGELITVVRAVQAALFCAGWLVKVDHERFIASTEREPYDLLNTANAELLRGFTSPRYAAAATLALTARISPHTLADIKLADVTEDGTAAIVADQQVLVPEEFAVFLRAQLCERRLDGAGSDDLLFGSVDRNRRRQQPPSARTLQTTLARVVRQTGIFVTSEFAGRENAVASHWVRRRGVSVQPLTAGQPTRAAA